MAMLPQIATQAPSGARKPQKPTAMPRSAAVPANVVESASQPADSPHNRPPR